MSTPKPILELVELLRHECEDAEVRIDAPKDPAGEWWLDVTCRKFQTSLVWRPKFGFGVFVAGAEGYGDRPDEIYTKPKDACARICQLVASTNARSVRPMRLKELRHIVGTSQVDLAERLSGPAQTPWGRRAVVCDPEGHKVELIEAVQDERARAARPTWVLSSSGRRNLTVRSLTLVGWKYVTGEWKRAVAKGARGSFVRYTSKN